jgi:hypothetical protein
MPVRQFVQALGQRVPPRIEFRRFRDRLVAQLGQQRIVERLGSSPPLEMSHRLQLRDP